MTSGPKFPTLRDEYSTYSDKFISMFTETESMGEGHLGPIMAA